MNKHRIAILGATSHIAKGLIVQFLQSKESYELYLFARSKKQVIDFLSQLQFQKMNIIISDNFSKLFEYEVDVLINSIGVGTSSTMGDNYHLWFTITETFDNLCTDYIKKYNTSLYISFSSGSIFGSHHTNEIDYNSNFAISVNHINNTDYYSIVRLYTETKHRSFHELRIIDLRIFNYFSRFINLNDGYFITELMKSIKFNKTFCTNSVDIIRDFLHPADLFKAIQCCYRASSHNTAYDLYSSAPVSKFVLLNVLKKKFSFSYTINNRENFDSATSNKFVYYSKNRSIEKIGYIPSYSSIDTVSKESEAIVFN